MFTINTQEKNPIYQQIMDQLVLFVSTGIMEPGDKLPSIRELASQLGINPNTVARAYTELEQNGFIETYPKKGAFVRDIAIAEEIETRAVQDLDEWYQRYLQLGLSELTLNTILKEASSHVRN